mgnify:CR=1 FL=1
MQWYAEFMEKFKKEIEELRNKMKAKGYPEGLINRAIWQAYGRAVGYAFKYFDHDHPERAKAIAEETFPKYLKDAEKWAREWLGSVFGVEIGEGENVASYIKKLRETIGE